MIKIIAKIDGNEVDSVKFDNGEFEQDDRGLRVYRGGHWYNMNNFKNYCSFCRDFNYYIDEEEDGEIEVVDLEDSED